MINHFFVNDNGASSIRVQPFDSLSKLERIWTCARLNKLENSSAQYLFFFFEQFFILIKIKNSNKTSLYHFLILFESYFVKMAKKNFFEKFFEK